MILFENYEINTPKADAKANDKTLQTKYLYFNCYLIKQRETLKDSNNKKNTSTGLIVSWEIKKPLR